MPISGLRVDFDLLMPLHSKSYVEVTKVKFSITNAEIERALTLGI